MKGVLTFTLGVLAGAAATALLTPVSGDELRERIKSNLRRRRMIAEDEVDALVEAIETEMDNAREMPAERQHSGKHHRK